MHVQLAPIDIVFGVIIGGASLRGALKGFVTETLSVAAIVCGVGAAVVLHKLAAGYLDGIWGASRWNQLVAFLAVFVAVYVVAKILEGTLHRLFETLRLQNLDRVLGLILGVVEGVVAVGLVLFLLLWQPFFDAGGLLQASTITRLLMPYLPSPGDFTVPEIRIQDV